MPEITGSSANFEDDSRVECGGDIGIPIFVDVAQYFFAGPDLFVSCEQAGFVSGIPYTTNFAV